jgi:hypothetical protein
VTELLASGCADERSGCRLTMTMTMTMTMTAMMTLGLLADDVVALAEIYRLPMLASSIIARIARIARPNSVSGVALSESRSGARQVARNFRSY